MVDIAHIGGGRSRIKFGPASLFAPLGNKSWCGESGRCFAHTVYSLIGCPAVAAATYILVRRAPGGRPRVLAISRTTSRTPSLNLARIRLAGANLGANEVHLHTEAATTRDRAAVVFDLETALAPGAKRDRATATRN